jgi:parallel beta-helix repeat protein
MGAMRLALACLVASMVAGHASARTVKVKDVPGLAAAVAHAMPGDEIVLADGTFLLTDKIAARAAGTKDAPILLRAEHRWKAAIRSSGQIAFQVTGPYWTIADLDIRGICADDATCEHAVQVVGAASGFRLVGNRLVDFNAQLKVNADGARSIPSNGLVEDNDIFDTHPRKTDGPVTKLDIDNGAGWVVRGNRIADFRKAGGNQVSYGAFVKGGAVGALFERNLVVCSRKRYDGGTRVGLSFGGGGMDPALCAPHWDAATPCDPEVTNGVIRNNIVANCSDVGIYLNRAAGTKVLFNTLVHTAGIDFRYASSSGEARGNLSSSYIHDRDDGTHTDGGNLAGDISDEALDALYKDARFGDLRLAADSAALAKAGVIGTGGAEMVVPDDFCGRPRAVPLDMGALQSSLGDWR